MSESLEVSGKKISTDAIPQLEVATTKFFNDDKIFFTFYPASNNTIIESLKKSQIHIEPKDEMGRTPLHYVCSRTWTIRSM